MGAQTKQLAKQQSSTKATTTVKPQRFATNGLIELGEHRTWKFFIQICLALDVIHEKGIVHADLKPSNLLMTGRDYDLKLTDFGVSNPTNDPHGISFVRRSVKICLLATTSPTSASAPCPTAAPKYSKTSRTIRRRTCGPSGASSTNWSLASVPSTLRVRRISGRESSSCKFRSYRRV